MTRLERGTAPVPRGGTIAVSKVMTADVAQAVEGLRAALAQVDGADDLVSAARTAVDRRVAETARDNARARLRKARAELDAVLLGPES